MWNIDDVSISRWVHIGCVLDCVVAPLELNRHATLDAFSATQRRPFLITSTGATSSRETQPRLTRLLYLPRIQRTNRVQCEAGPGLTMFMSQHLRPRTENVARFGRDLKCQKIAQFSSKRREVTWPDHTPERQQNVTSRVLSTQYTIHSTCTEYFSQHRDGDLSFTFSVCRRCGSNSNRLLSPGHQTTEDGCGHQEQ